MKKHVKRISLQILGIVCLLAGVAGIFLPLLQGWLFIIMGLVLISVSTPWAKRHIEHHTHKHPKSKELHQRLERWVLDIVGEL